MKAADHECSLLADVATFKVDFEALIQENKALTEAKIAAEQRSEQLVQDSESADLRSEKLAHENEAIERKSDLLYQEKEAAKL